MGRWKDGRMRKGKEDRILEGGGGFKYYSINHGTERDVGCLGYLLSLLAKRERREKEKDREGERKIN